MSEVNHATYDPVNHPRHYTAGGIECIDAIRAALTSQKDPMQAWLTGQILKYLWRWPLKNGLEDLEKAKFYLDKLIADVKYNTAGNDSSSVDKDADAAAKSFRELFEKGNTPTGPVLNPCIRAGHQKATFEPRE